MTDSILAKSCGKCSTALPISEFHKRKAARDGLHPHCKSCVRQADRARYQSKHEARLAQMAAWRAGNRDASRAASRRWARANTERVQANLASWRGSNRDRIAEYERNYYRENIARRREYSRQWAADNPDRRRAADTAYRNADPTAHNLRVSEWKRQNRTAAASYDRKKKAKRRGARRIAYSYSQLTARLSVFGFRCYLCGSEGEAVDHVKPLAAGGWDCLANLRPICTSCNSRKGATWPFERALPAFRFIA